MPHRLRVLLADVGATRAARDRRRAAGGRLDGPRRVGLRHRGAVGRARAARLGRRDLRRRGRRSRARAQGDRARAHERPAARVRRRGAVRAPRRPLRLRQGFGPEALFAPDPARLPEVLEPVLRRARRAPDADTAHRLLLAQQAITDHVAAGLPPDELCARVLAALGEALGWTYGAVWRPDGESSMLRATAMWHDAAAGPAVAAFADVSRRLKIAPGRGLPGRAYAFRRPAWVADVRADGNMARHTARAARRADHRGRLPDRARRRLRRRDRVLLRRHPRARRAGRGHVRHRRRPARPVPRAAPAAGRREPPRRGDAPRRARPRAALPRRRRDDDRRPRHATARSCSSTARAAPCSTGRSASCSAATGSSSPCPTRSAPRCGAASTG